MLFTFLLALAASPITIAVPFTHQHRHQHGHRSSRPQHRGELKVASATFLGDQKSDLPVVRDLGFVGKIGNTTIHTYGDTLSSVPGQFYMTSDSSSIGTDDPLFVRNTQRTEDGQHPTDMVSPHHNYSETNTTDAFGGTNVIPTSGKDGMMFFLKNHRPGGNNTIIGAGVASVHLSHSRNVSTERLCEYWWDGQAGEPWYGDIGGYSDSEYIYGYGHGGMGEGFNNHMHVYLNRVPISGWKELSNWEYYDGSTSTWSKNRIYNPTDKQALHWNDAEGPAWAVAQGQMVWSPYYNKILWVFTMAMNDAVFARTADRPEGPWSKEVKLYDVKRKTEGSFVYCAVANPYFDESGRSVIVTVNNGADCVQVTRVEFE